MANKFSQIELSELSQRLQEGALLIDVREEDEVALGMIEGAIHIALSSFPEAKENFRTDCPIVFYCRSGRRSEKACQIAMSWTDKPLYNLIGGYLNYELNNSGSEK